MATQKRLQKDDIERARQVLLAAIYSGLPDDRFIKKQAVKQLLSTLIAARDSGMPFEKIAEVLKTAGLEISSETLRSYFFELKTQEELAVEAQRHAKKVLQTKTTLDRRSLDQHVEHATSVAAEHVRQAQGSPRLFNAFQSLGTREEETVSRASMPKGQVDRPDTVEALTNASRSNNNQANEPTIVEPAGQQSFPTSEKRASTVATSPDAPPLTIAEIEHASQATDERVALDEDVELRGDVVVYVSGRPFRGTLTKKQIHLLKTVGRIVAPTQGKSTKDFVVMPPKL